MAAPGRPTATPAPESRVAQVRVVTVEDIEDAYRRGYLTAESRNRLLREKAHVTVGDVLDEKGYLGAILAQTIQHVQEGWENLKASAVRDPTADLTTELYYVGLAVWGQVQILTSIFAGIGEVTGQVAENMALRAGASPGLARVINIATDIGTGFVPVGAAIRSGVKGIRAIQTARASRAAGAATQAAAEAQKGAEAAQVAARALADGLAVEGAEDAAKVMREAVQAAGKPAVQVAEGAAREAGEAAAKAAPEAAAGTRGTAEAAETVQETFTKDLRRFRREIATITATQTHEETARLAKKLGYTLDDLREVVPGQALDEKQIFAYLKALEPQADRLIELANAVVAEGTEAAGNALARHASEFFTVAPIFRGAEVTLGRGVEILKETPPMKTLTDLLMGWDPEAIAKGDFQGAMRTFAEDLVAMAEAGKEKVTALAVQSQSGWQRFKADWWPMAREAYINLLLARPITQVRNFIGNSVAATTAVAERLTGAVFSADRQAGLVGQEGVYLAKGMLLAMGDGIQAFARTFKTLSPEEVSRLDYVPGAIPGLLGRLIRLPGNATLGMDNFFKTMLRRGSYYAQAIREGVQSGRESQQLADFVARRVTHPTQAMVKEAEAFALTNTFQNDLGTLATAARGLQKGPLVLWFPFMKTPINLAKYAWNRTPGLQLLSKSLYDDIAIGGTRMDLAIGRLTLSNLMGMFLFELAKDGLITGGGPVDPALRRAWLATHEPYAIRTKDGWLPITNTEPGTTTLGLVADFAQVLNQLDEPSAEQGAMAITFAVLRDLADKTYWRTVSDLVDLASAAKHGEEPGKRLTDVFLSPVTTVVTGGPLVAATARAIDPIRRETRTFVDGLLARTPGYSSTLPPLRDGYGEPILPPQAIGGPWVGLASPLTFRPAETDRVKREGDRLQVRLPQFPWSIGGAVPDAFDLRQPMPEDRLGVALSPQQRDRWQVLYRGALRDPEIGLERQLLNAPLYQGQPRALQREMFGGLLADYRTMAKERLLLEDPALAKKVLESEATRIAPLLQQEDQDALQETLRETIGLYDTLMPEQRDNLLRWGEPEPEPTP